MMYASLYKLFYMGGGRGGGGGGGSGTNPLKFCLKLS